MILMYVEYVRKNFFKEILLEVILEEFIKVLNKIYQRLIAKIDLKQNPEKEKLISKLDKLQL